MEAQLARKLIMNMTILHQCEFNKWILSLHGQIIFKNRLKMKRFVFACFNSIIVGVWIGCKTASVS